MEDQKEPIRGIFSTGPLSVLSDLMLMVGLGIIIASYYALVNQIDSLQSTLIRNLLFSVSISILLYVSFRLMFVVLNRYLPWETHRVRRVLVEIPAIFSIAIALTIPFTLFFFGLAGAEVTREQLISNTALSVLISLLINTFTEGIAIFRLYRDTLIDKERLKQETLRSHFETLKNQVGPHFLFNSLNTLIALIDESPQTAKNFVQKLSNYYRYVIQVNQEALVPLSIELDLVKDYVFLLNQRYDHRIVLQIDIPPEAEKNLIPPLALQMLVENAEKHNAISAEKRLNIRIALQNNQIVVENSRTPKKNIPPGTGTGLENIRKRFALAAHQPIHIESDSSFFRVSLPIIPQS